MIISKRVRIAMFVLLTAAFPAGSVAGDVIDITDGVTLDQLVGHSFVVDDKLFDVLSYVDNGTSSSQVTITPVDFGMAGVGFDMTGPLSISGQEEGNNLVGFSMLFRVTVLDPALYIVDAHLAFDGSVGADDDGEAFAAVRETVSGDDLRKILEVSVNSDSSEDLTDSAVFYNYPQTTLLVEKEVILFATDGEICGNGVGWAEIDYVRQMFSQVPEPTGLATLIVGGCLFICRRRGF